VVSQKCVVDMRSGACSKNETAGMCLLRTVRTVHYVLVECRMNDTESVKLPFPVRISIQYTRIHCKVPFRTC
jgi:hypothetical protein